jgi:hypothetical protein
LWCWPQKKIRLNLQDIGCITLFDSEWLHFARTMM